MIDCDTNKLIELATRFRAAIMKCDPKFLIITLKNFPNGACGDAALLLAKYLEDNECGKFDYVLGYRKGKSHAWLQRDSVIVDITADQFQDQDKPVIVTEDHTWHSQFNIENRHMADFTSYDKSTVNILLQTYKQILWAAQLPFKLTKPS